MKLLFLSHEKIGPVPNQVFAGNSIYYRLIQWAQLSQIKFGLEHAQLAYTDQADLENLLGSKVNVVALDTNASELLAMMGVLHFRLPEGEPEERFIALDNFLING